MVKFDRATTEAELQTHGIVKYLTITDTEHDVSLDLEAKMVNNYDVKTFAELLQIRDHHVDGDDAG
ncbi:MAG: hypothetical protein IPM45_10070 [Acidimicrobiales bacterium]|nr:hypothetical protein [Acidimicrobiales bacterium]